MKEIQKRREETQNRPVLLLIDDSPDFRSLCKEIFNFNNYDVITAADGFDGIEYAVRCQKIRGILLDIMMPGLSGWEVANILADISETKHIPILLITGVRTNNLAERITTEHRNVDYLHKPFGVEDLLSKVDNLINLPSPKSTQ
ncbi:MAG: response regulator [Candidatus Daviesbacteria bacterium]|nr:response regulator [Candidatus Daviesbacteria bacterium]